MRIYGKEVYFRLTVGSAAEIAALCPGGDLQRVGEMLEGSFTQTAEFAAKFIVALNKGYVQQKKWEGETADEVCVDEIMSLDTQAFFEVQMEAMKSFNSDSEGEIETKESKKNTGDESSPSNG